MSYTIAEKILGRASRAGVPVRAGTEVDVKPDYVLGYDFPGYLDLIFKQMKGEFGIERVAEPEAAWRVLRRLKRKPPKLMVDNFESLADGSGLERRYARLHPLRGHLQISSSARILLPLRLEAS